MAVTSTDLLVIERGGTLYKAPVSELPSGGGGGAAGLTLLQKETITTAVAAVDFDIPSGYSNFIIRINGMSLDAGRRLQMTVSTDGGSSFLTGGYNSEILGKWMGGSSSSTYAGEDADQFYLTTHGDDNIYANMGLTVIADMIGFDVAASVKAVGGGTSYFYTAEGTGARITSARTDVIRFARNGGGNITGGTIFLYGLKESV